MKGLAAKNGMVVVRPVAEFLVPQGKSGFRVGSEVRRLLGRKSYFLQYVLAANDVLFYFTFEGEGEAEPAMQRIDAIFETQEWDE